MRPTDLSLERERRARKRFALTVRQVRLAATSDDIGDLHRIVANVDAGLMALADGHDHLRALQAQQQRRAA